MLESNTVPYIGGDDNYFNWRSWEKNSQEYIAEIKNVEKFVCANFIKLR